MSLLREAQKPDLDLRGCVMPFAETTFLPKPPLRGEGHHSTAELEQIAEAKLETARQLEEKALISTGVGLGVATIGLALRSRRIISAGILTGVLGAGLGMASVHLTRAGYEAGDASEGITDRARQALVK